MLNTFLRSSSPRSTLLRIHVISSCRILSKLICVHNWNETWIEESHSLVPKASQNFPWVEHTFFLNDNVLVPFSWQTVLFLMWLGFRIYNYCWVSCGFEEFSVYSLSFYVLYPLLFISRTMLLCLFNILFYIGILRRSFWFSRGWTNECFW